MEPKQISDDERRRKPRYILNLPAIMNGDGTHDVEMVDISSTGMQIRSGKYDIFKGSGFVPDKKEQLKMHFSVRLAWAEPQPDGGFLTGWKFEMESQEDYNSD